jgi:N-acetylglucosaminyldiphosphoundecaprenol N-acetyl-beta-D-mannosaminyltransferase
MDLIRPLSRQVYCVLGMPVDGTDMIQVLADLRAAARDRTPLLLSTPNLNFLINCQTNEEFRESLLISDLCPPDGMSIMWIARLLSIPLKSKVSGSDIFECLNARRPSQSPMTVFLFGSTETVISEAAKRINSSDCGIKCIGWVSPGFGTVDEMSTEAHIQQINASKADFLIVALGAVKGQLWLKRNHHRLTIPVRSHLGAVVNFQAGVVKRSPVFLQKMGLEWLWRIKEEPALWRRYWHDGSTLIRLLFTRILPLVLLQECFRVTGSKHPFSVIRQEGSNSAATFRLAGFATAKDVANAVDVFGNAAVVNADLLIDCSELAGADSRFLGFLQVLNQQHVLSNTRAEFVGMKKSARRLFRLNGLEYLLQQR